MAIRDLPDMYTRSPRAAGSRDESIHIRQITNGHVTTIMYHFVPIVTTTYIPRACGPRASGIHIRQIPHGHVTTITYICLRPSGFGYTYQANPSWPCYNYYIYVIVVTWPWGTICCYIYVIVVTWPWGICLICIPEARGPQARGMRVYISGKSRMAMLQLLCITLFP